VSGGNDNAPQAVSAAASTFEASAPAAGYAMQFRYALLCAVQRLQSGDLDWQIAIEAGDDVEVIPAPGYASLHQIKLRAKGTTLTDGSRDLWKTLRIWATRYEAAPEDLGSTQFFLVTTSTAPANSVADHLGPVGDRDIEYVVRVLDDVSMNSSSRDNAKAYEAWNSLDYESKIALLRRITVICEGPSIEDALTILKNSCALCVRRAFVSSFVSRLEGWWFQQCVGILRASNIAFITGEEFDGAFSDLRDAFLPENLPVDSDVPLLSPSVDTFADYLFVRQIELVGVNVSRIASAVRDYMRAYTQRSRWTREGLVGLAELKDYERRLTEEWRYVFDRLRDTLPPEATEVAKTEVAKAVYQWVEEAMAPPIRNLCVERFLVRGSLHMLADRIDSGVGWHPDFAVRLIAILEPIAK
jgi:hypothetical protein